MDSKHYHRIIDAEYRWGTWAALKKEGGKIDHNGARTGDDLREFVNHKLFPYLASSREQIVPILSSTRLVKSSARLTTNYKVAIPCER